MFDTIITSHARNGPPLAVNTPYPNPHNRACAQNSYCLPIAQNPYARTPELFATMSHIADCGATKTSGRALVRSHSLRAVVIVVVIVVVVLVRGLVLVVVQSLAPPQDYDQAHLEAQDLQRQRLRVRVVNAALLLVVVFVVFVVFVLALVSVLVVVVVVVLVKRQQLAWGDDRDLTIDCLCSSLSPLWLSL